ncbi:MAG: protein translocase subunit SecD [Candidatus Omnitrophota bacterium]
MNKNLKIRLGIVLAVFLASLWFAFPIEKKINLGLDLKGGMHLVLRVETEKIEDPAARKDAVQRAVEILRNRIDSMGVGEPVIQLQGEDQILIQLPGITDRDTAKQVIGKVAQLEFSLVEESPEFLKQAFEGNIPEGYQLKQIKDKSERILVNQKPAMTGEEIADARVDFDTSGFGQPKIALSFKSKGAKDFAEITRDNVNQRLAIILDGQVLSAPTINEPILSGNAEISGQFAYDEAALLALALRSGSLPAPMHIEEERTVGPLLGKDSINAGITAILIGGSLVFAFMLLYYLTAGIIADLALAINLSLIFGIMGLLNVLLPESQVTLTLPGFAGIVLTLGMAVDSNILINERIREELNNGQSLRAAINAGFKKAFSAIIDSNLTTLIAAFMLFQFGSGPIKGFAVTLSIGLIASLFTAVFVTKTLFLALEESKILKSLPMLNIFKNTNFNFVNKCFIAITASLVIIIFTMFNFYKNYDKVFGIDFAGGQIQEYRFKQPVESQDIRKVLESSGVGQFVIQRFEKSPETILIRSANQIDEKVMEALRQKLPENPFEVLRVESVGPVVGEELRKKALLAMAFALAGILIYVGYRFHHFDFAAAGVIALLHDVAITFGLLVVMGRQIDLLVITALLTIAGYSINDTIVIYDRVRENSAKMRRASLKDIINTSINQTLGRTVLTTLSTLLVVVSLFLKGGEVLNTFALALLIGFIAGTYSTVFIASPLVLMWEKRKK